MDDGLNGADPSETRPDIQLIQPAKVKDYWSFIRPGLEALKDRYPEMCRWIPEDIYACVVQPTADLFIGFNGERPIGFCVGYKKIIPFTGEFNYFVWLVWGLHDRDRKRGDHPSAVFQQHCQNFLIAYAKGLGLSQLEAWTAYTGYFEKLGWHLQSHTYVLNI